MKKLLTVLVALLFVSASEITAQNLLKNIGKTVTNEVINELKNRNNKEQKSQTQNTPAKSQSQSTPAKASTQTSPQATKVSISEVCTNPQIVSENGIKSINIPLNVKSIGDSVFIECSQLERVTIPSTVESFGQIVFAFCNKLSTVYINVKFKNYQDVANIFEGTNLITSTDFDQCPAIKWTE